MSKVKVCIKRIFMDIRLQNVMFNCCTAIRTKIFILLVINNSVESKME